MSYKIVISNTESDQEIANTVTHTINSAFNGDIILYLRRREIKSGNNRKDEIKNYLSGSDAIISVITKNSIKNPWIFIEWSVYWMANKNFYILIYDDVKITDLVREMQDSQLTYLTDANSVKSLFSRLSDDSGCNYIPFEKAIDLVNSLGKIKEKRKINIFL